MMDHRTNNVPRIKLLALGCKLATAAEKRSLVNLNASYFASLGWWYLSRATVS
jgi:hypothetical protein